MKKTLAIILSVVMLFGVMPFASFAADAEPVYDRAAVAANDEAYIDGMNAEQIASVILDWVDREIAKYTDEMKAAATEAVIAGFEGFELTAFGDVIAAQIPDIASLDDVITYKNYLAELGGDFANLDASALITRAEAGSAIGFIDGVFQFMADNSEVFGKVFRWDEEVFDYGKVGEYILSLDPADPENKKIIDFYNDYLIGNDIQAKFTKWVADQMNYAIPEGEAFDDTLNNGIIGWFAGLCEKNDILSADAVAELKTYDLRTNDIYTLVKNFVALAEEDNKVKIDTYYNYLLDTVARTLVKTMLGQKAVVGAEVEVPAGFTAVYTDLALLEEISGGTAYYYDGADYYQVTVANGALSANALTWEAGFEMNLEPIYANVYTGADRKTAVQTYEPKSTDIAISTYASQKNQDLVVGAGLEFTGTEVPAEYADLMSAAPKALTDGFLFNVTQGENVIADLDISFEALETEVKALALTTAQNAIKGILTPNGLAEDAITVEAINFDVVYNAWTTEDEFICAVDATDLSVTLGGTVNSIILGIAQSAASTAVATAAGNIYDTPIATIVVDGLAGGGADYFGQAEALLNFVNDDFVVDQTLLDFTANYDAYNGVVGQVNRVLVGLVKIFVNEDLGLKEGGNEYLTDNLQTLCDKVNGMMAAANDLINNEDLQGMIKELGIDFDALTADLPLDLLYSLDFSSVEALWVTVITLGLDVIDDGSDELIAEIHALIGDLENLDAMAVAGTDYLLGKCIPELNAAFANSGVDFALTVPAKTDAAAVADGAGKDIIMTKAVDLLYEAATEGVALVNSIANELIGHVEGEASIDLPTVALELKVEKGADWKATLAGLVNRVYELADGIILVCAEKPADTIDAISKVANAILPLGSLASNCASENYAFDGNLVMGFLFDDGLEGDLEGFLSLFETKEKTEDVAADVSVTEALIMASEHIVDAFFPDTVKSELYVDNYATGKFTETTVQEYFTGAENDAVIASNNMDSLNALKADLVPAALNLVREAGVLPFFAKCDKDHNALTDAEKVIVPGKAATCTETGTEDTVKCAECGYVVSGGGVIDALDHDYKYAINESTCTATGTKTITCSRCDYNNVETIPVKPHSYGAWSVTTAATCTANGVETRACACGNSETRAIAATGHVDADGNYVCDACGAELEKEVDNSFFGKIKAFFQRIIEWFKNLFKF
ncbi:MAG: hypothetical protein IJB74_09045 [Clostridia bacterium]|nr:hypothetical protein [Clostridia bacterium]